MTIERREFLKGGAAGLAALAASPAFGWSAATPVIAHLFVYTSLVPAGKGYDAYPFFDRAFGEVKDAGFEGIELMAANLRHDDAVDNIRALSKKHHIPISGCTFSTDMWNAEKHDANVKDATMLLDKLAELGGKTFGCTVGDAKRAKTDAEFDVQASALREIRAACGTRGITPNLHNHIFELADGMRDLKGTLARIPDFPLGPDFNWMMRAGVDPVEFIHTYGKQIVYFHLRDQGAAGVWTEYLGQGVTPFTAIASALKAIPFKGRCGVEHALPAGYEPRLPLGESWKRSRAYVRTTFGW